MKHESKVGHILIHRSKVEHMLIYGPKIEHLLVKQIKECCPIYLSEFLQKLRQKLSENVEQLEFLANF